jgi:predicted HicB family RNase H-like nuclease
MTIRELKTKFFTMRLTESLHQKIKKEAVKQNRTLTDQINHILIRYFDK